MTSKQLNSGILKAGLIAPKKKKKKRNHKSTFYAYEMYFSQSTNFWTVGLCNYYFGQHNKDFICGVIKRASQDLALSRACWDTGCIIKGRLFI